MAYDKRNLLLKIIEIQNIVIKEQSRGLSQKWIFDNFIGKQYFIAYPTFKAYLARNAKRELSEMEARKEEDERQLNLLF